MYAPKCKTLKLKLKRYECSRNSEQIPVFGNMSSNITVQREGTAFLHCPVKNPGDRPVSYPLVSKYKQKCKYTSKQKYTDK